MLRMVLFWSGVFAHVARSFFFLSETRKRFLYNLIYNIQYIYLLLLLLYYIIHTHAHITIKSDIITKNNE